MIDLSRLPAPLAIEALDANALKAAFLLRFVFFWDEQRLVDPSLPRFEVTNLEANPVSIIAKAWSYLRLLDRARVNDAVRSGLLAFARDADLDHLGLFYNVGRRTVRPAANGEPALLETDDEFRRRVQLAPEAFSNAGTPGAYLFHALSSDPDVLDADVWSPGPGRVEIAVQSRTGDGEASAALVARVLAHLSQDHIKPLTDSMSVRSVTNRPYRIDLEGFVRAGPHVSLVTEEVRRSLLSLAAARRSPRRDMPLSAIYAAAHVGSVERVFVRSPVVDIASTFGEVPVLSAVNVEVSVDA